ncbi:MAG: DUF4493 domain-containing protein [Bacteroidales bacterium]|nr:DUF4493 domain-containing protein [Bacteroidales bacterium]
MKKILSAFAVLAVLSACSDKVSPNKNETGTLSLTLSSTGDYITKAGQDDTAEFKISISRSDGWISSYDRFADMPEILDLAEGDYTITASSPESKPAAFDLPIYGATQNFTIRVGELTPVSLVCTLQNMKVSFALSENFKKELSDYNISVTNAASWTAEDAGERTLTWDKAAADAGTPGYFSVAPLMVKVDGYRNIDNSEAHAMLSITDVAPRDHHVIYIDAQVTGSVNGINIKVDDTVNEKNSDIFIPGWDETPVDGGEDEGGDDPDEPSTAPTMSWDTNPTFAPTPIEDVMDVNISIKAPETIEGFIVTVDSYILSDVIAAMGGNTTYSWASDGPFDMDLINDEALVSALSSMLPTGDELSGKSEVVFSLSTIVPLIKAYNPESGSNHIFTLKVTDAKGQTLSKSITFVMP